MEEEKNYESHSFSVELASKIGLEETLILGHLYHWCIGNADNETMFKDEHIWVYITRKRINEQYPYLTENKIRGALNRLEQKGYIKIANYNKIKIDKTNWYALTNDAYNLFGTSLVKITKRWLNSPSVGENHQAIQSIKQNYKNKTINKEIYKEIVDFWNEHTKSYSKIRQVTKKIESAINSRIIDGYSIDDIKKALLLCESLGDFYKGKEPGKNWKANFYWIISNTNSNFDKILIGDLHISNEQLREFKKVMNGEEYNSTQYHPSTNGSDVCWNEPSQCYICFYPWAFDNLCDGYTKDTRPDNAIVYCQGRKYVWSKKQQKWEHD